jgi:predicted nucleotidyltransferase
MSSFGMKYWSMSLKTDPRTIDWQQSTQIWREAADVIAVWAFGSAQHGQVAPGSDADVAVWFEASPPFEQQLALLARLQEALGLDEIDLVVLNDANPILRFEAISGQMLYCRDRNRCAGFASLTAREYEDAMAFWERAVRTRT